MKARKKGTNDEFVPFGVTLKDNWTIYNQDDIEFDTEQTPASDNAHWQDVRERAAIAAMQGSLANTAIRGTPEYFASDAIRYADALVEQLKKKTK